MRGRRYSTEGIVLARRDYSEADRILVLFTKHFGKLSVIAKGVRKPKSRKRGHIEVFSNIKFAAAKGKGLDIITEVETIDDFKSIRADLKKVSVAYYLMEVVGRVTREEEKNERLFNLIIESLKTLKKQKALREFRFKYVYDVLVLLGFWPPGKPMNDPDSVLEEVTERKINSVRVGKKVLS